MSQTVPPTVLHVIVIGFHHKKGCQVEFSYPPLMPPADNDEDKGVSTECCPAGWKYLPTLGLPDGSHNFVEDSVFFNLPSLVDPNETVFGVSCYRQISVEKLKNRTADVTRSTVQKSVCILASTPVFGYIEVKLSLVAHAYFDQGDFERTDILVKFYDNIRLRLAGGLRDATLLSSIFVGLPLREIILRWRYKTLILFKLMLLQKRVICFGSPVRPISALILSIVSLQPQLLESGFFQAACVRTSRPMSPMPNFQSQPSPASLDESTPADRPNYIHNNDNDNNIMSNTTIQNPNLQQQQQHQHLLLTTISVEHPDDVSNASTTTDDNLSMRSEVIHDDINRNPDDQIDGDKPPKLTRQRSQLPKDASVDVFANRLQSLCNIQPDTWSAPIPLFTPGHLCLPYLSLPYMDLLSDASVHSYTIGTSNILFQQKKHLADVFVNVEATSIETTDPANADIRRQLQLTTEDLRFVDHILRHVQAPRENAEGSEQWIRAQFEAYAVALLRTSLLADGSKECDPFNGFFVAEWRQTDGYRMWLEKGGARRLEEEAALDGGDWMVDAVGHPFAGTLSVGDMKLKIAQTMNNSESGRKLNQAVNTTSKAVGGAILQAKGALSNWWSAMTTQPPVVAQSESPQDPTSSVPTEHTSLNAAAKHAENPSDVAQQPTTRDRPPTTDEPGKSKSLGVVEIGHEAVSALDANPTVFTV